MSVNKWRLPIVTICFIAGILFYVVGVQLTFPWSDRFLRPELIALLLLTSISGCIVLGLGYLSAVFIGGRASLVLMEFYSRITGSKQVIEETDSSSILASNWFLKLDFAVFVPLLTFVTSMALAWDIYNVHHGGTGLLSQLLAALDIFSKPPRTSPIIYSMDIIPVMMLLFAIVGIVPSAVSPYFRKFKIISVNGGPFHTTFLFAFVGVVSGLGALLSLAGYLYSMLWVSKGTVYYHYILPALVGLSLHYSIGLFLGRKRSEDLVRRKLLTMSSERIIKGSIKITRDE